MSNALQHKLSASALTGRNELQMIGLLGAGGSGTVYRGELRTDEGSRPVAVKVPHRGCDLRREASVMQRFSHQNIAQLITGPATSSDPLILELCSQGTLEDQLAEQLLPLREVKEIVVAVGEALTVLHSAGWLHGDVNPSNIGLRTRGGPCLLDFGCARPFDSSLPTSGTREYGGESIPLIGELDIRALAASANAALSPTHQCVKAELDQFVAQADGGESVSIQQLIDLLEDSSQSTQLTPLFPDDTPLFPDEIVSTGGPADPPRPRTREFGPRPQPAEPAAVVPAAEPAHDQDIWHRKVVGFLLLALVFFGAFARSSGSSDPQTLEPVALLERVTAADTLENAGATWSGNGVISLELDGELRTFAAGKAGDIAAIADWNCAGEPTLGIYRPGTGAWFTFNSWQVDAVSTVETLRSTRAPSSLRSLEVEAELSVVVDGQGCARPTVG